MNPSLIDTSFICAYLIFALDHDPTDYVTSP